LLWRRVCAICPSLLHFLQVVCVVCNVNIGLRPISYPSPAFRPGRDRRRLVIHRLTRI
jgi:hypothetical protein